MYTEIEAKLKIDSPADIEHRLAELGAQFVAQRLQRDAYFNDTHSTIAKKDRCLRLRRESVNKTKRFILSHKGARQKDNFKKRQEIEVEVADGDATEELLSALGYKQVLLFEKRRRLWMFADCIIALDELPLLGFFVEIEGPDDQKISAVQEKLGLAHLPHIPESYARLVTDKLSELGYKKKELFL
jgi:adenylate cyclase class 2